MNRYRLIVLTKLRKFFLDFETAKKYYENKLQLPLSRVYGRKRPAAQPEIYGRVLEEKIDFELVLAVQLYKNFSTFETAEKYYEQKLEIPLNKVYGRYSLKNRPQVSKIIEEAPGIDYDYLDL